MSAPWKLIAAPANRDPRGVLSVLEQSPRGPSLLPFTPARIMWMYDVPVGMRRGEHAHREQHQLFICVAGVLEVLLDDGTRQETVVLDRPHLALHVPPLVWGEQVIRAPGTAYVLLASGPFDPQEYIKTRDAWKALL